jgi:UDP-3-O-[3-hydroxymyristoyl] glucosamine N-acyltransferase
LEITLGALASLLGADLTDPERSDVKVSNIASIAEAGPDDLAFLWDAKFRDQATRCRAGALVTGEAIEGQACLVVADPEAALLAILGRVHDERCPPIEAGVHETAFVAGSASLGEGAAIGPQAVVEAGAVIGARAQIRGRAQVGIPQIGGVIIEDDVEIGALATVARAAPSARTATCCGTPASRPASGLVTAP